MKIVYNSLDGRFSDSPRALYLALSASPTQGSSHTWVVGGGHEHSFPGVDTVPPEGPATVAALEDADLVISNTHLRPQWRKKPGAVYLQTWHGTPLKHIAGHEPSHEPGTPVPGHQDIDRWDLLLSPNDASAPRLAGAFAYDGPVAVTGYPRNDALLADGAAAVRARVRNQLGLRPGDRAVLYTPTWRDDVLDDQGRRDVDLRLDLAAAAHRLAGPGRPAGSPRTVLLLRLHYMVSDRLGPLDLGQDAGVVDVSAHPDIAELYLAADAMVTDYSSTMFDFAVTGKPLLFYVYDLEHYRDDLRGFYVDLERVAPGPLLRTSEELLDALAALAADTEAASAPWQERYRSFREDFCHAEDGHATQRVLELVTSALSQRGRADVGARQLQDAGDGLVNLQAVILAAGKGTRLGRPLPKPLTALRDGRSILVQQVENLRSVFGDDLSITVVVGFKAPIVMEAVPHLLFAYNEDYESTNTSKSLLRALSVTQPGPVLWLNGDVVFDPALLHLLHPAIASGTSAVCVNSASVGEEEVKYTLGSDGYVAELSKTVVGGLGEAVGINLVADADRAALVDRLAQCSDDDYFERGIELVITQDGTRFAAVDISAYVAVEVDFEEDLARAEALRAGS